MSSAVATSVMVVGPWALLMVSILLLALIPSLVRLVLRTVPSCGDRDVSVRVRLLLWLCIEIEVKSPQHVVTDARTPSPSGLPPADVVPIRKDVP